MLAQVDPVLVAQVLPLLAGPGAAVLVLVGVLLSLYMIAVKHIVPLATAVGKRHLEQIDTLIATQKAESIAITKTLSSIDRRLARIEGLTDGGQYISPTSSGALSPDRNN
jgi:hypothetical protein